MENERLKAAEKGDSRYIGKPCRACGGTERFVTNGNCVQCAAEHSRKYREKVKALIEQAKVGA